MYLLYSMYSAFAFQLVAVTVSVQVRFVTKIIISIGNLNDQVI